MGVIMNYQKFMELVPKETKDFVFTVLKNYSKYEDLYLKNILVDGCRKNIYFYIGIHIKYITLSGKNQVFTHSQGSKFSKPETPG